MIAVSSCVSTFKRVGVALLSLVLLATAARAQDEGAPDEFHVGDRIALTVEGPMAFSDTVVVREGRTIQLPQIGDIQLAGVRRADAEKYLTQQISRFVKNPVVHAIPLVRVAILGQVRAPGFYSVPSDALMSDVVMRAGGPTPDADMNKTVVKRNDKDVLSQSEVANALSTGLTLDDLRVAPGRSDSRWGKVEYQLLQCFADVVCCSSSSDVIDHAAASLIDLHVQAPFFDGYLLWISN